MTFTSGNKDLARSIRWKPAPNLDPLQLGAVDGVAALDILVNNAGVDLHDDLSERAGIDRHLAVNLFGTHSVTQAFLPLLARSQGTIVNVLSLAGLASVPFGPAYSFPDQMSAGEHVELVPQFWRGRICRRDSPKSQPRN
jgi:NAD(P)-dependent dehydrogenase (short-subunit alcohol dehydrogenase family)